ncbi:maltokinase N-terminal cap-like domain-containing protein [Allokutzneria albata]|uniref:Maltokinase n=1 Tax=Allokutzneria albata TaxID=211114 RepID=A0A1G9XNE6_ALLAB|nr:aminoglycoside phosphotransferase [Allokutzneria albata]SDM98011.1 maltokinase [Allokutzneria albata]
MTSSPTEVITELADALREWLPTQRWFAGKDRAVASVRPVQAVSLVDGDPALLHAVVEVRQNGSADRYQLLVGLRSDLPEHLGHAWIGTRAELACYDATQDTELTGLLLDLIARGQTHAGLDFQHEPGVELEIALKSRPVGAEQSNTSLVYGHHYILKLFRKLVTGTNPDLTLHRALRTQQCEHIAEPLGAIQGTLDGEEVTFGMLQRFLPDAADGWAMATASVRDLMAEGDLHPDEVGGDFAGEARRLGQAVAEVHADLAAALGSGSEGRDLLDRTVDAMQRRLDAVLASVPELGAHEQGLRSAFDAARELSHPIAVQHIHGDLHLGQVLRTVLGWVLIDFEGEPAAPAAERLSLRSPLRDVAGMLRSFDYAAHQLLVGYPGGSSAEDQLTVRALEWARRNRDAFCDGYAEKAADPREHAVLLRALELDKAVYEVAYEHGNRPEWLAVPLSSIARITGS